MVEIIKGVHQVDGVNANSYFVAEDDGSLTLIDSGMPKDGKEILDYLQGTLSRKTSDLKTIILTHSHIDHVRGASAIKKATGAKIAIHADDADYLSGKKAVPRPKGAMGSMFKVLSPFFGFDPVEPDQLLKESDKIGRFTVVHTPGHTPGSIALYDPARKLVFVGDTIRYVNGKVQGPPNQFTLDMKTTKLSIEKISNLDFQVMLAGHGRPLNSPDAAQKVKEFSNSFMP